MKTLKIYLGDVTHDIGLRTRVVPMGIATLACALQDNFKQNVSTKLFVYPNKIFDEIKLNNSGTSSKLIEFVSDRPGHDFRYAIDFYKN